MATRPGMSWKSWNFVICPGMSWTVLEYGHLSWKCPGILHRLIWQNLCLKFHNPLVKTSVEEDLRCSFSHLTTSKFKNFSRHGGGPKFSWFEIGGTWFLGGPSIMMGLPQTLKETMQFMSPVPKFDLAWCFLAEDMHTGSAYHIVWVVRPWA